jgi:RHS repeat-associated protein
VARRDGPTGAAGVFYYFSDHLKTASVITDSAGVIKAESDYYPWGGELQFVNNDSNDYKFTGKKRDIETGLDYFGARYYSNGLGRWASADWSATPIPVPYADFHDPQSLNLYTYVRNLPTTRVDADGHEDDLLDKLKELFYSLVQPVTDAHESKGSASVDLNANPNLPGPPASCSRCERPLDTRVLVRSIQKSRMANLRAVATLATARSLPSKQLTIAIHFCVLSVPSWVIIGSNGRA